jgi:TRAP-type C4-dicarboxylate transport system substrate-binding protein
VASERKDIDISSAASAMSKKRWASLSEEERNAAMEKARAARQRKLSKARRVEIARLAVNARWAKARAAKHTEKPAGRTKKGKTGDA